MRLNLIQRIRNLWRLSLAIEVDKDASDSSIHIKKETELAKQSKKMAQIIKRRDPVKEALKNE